jgi:protein-arginine kinase activator protein McsA
MIERMCCAKCQTLMPTNVMKLIKMGKTKRLVCNKCFNKANTSWFSKAKEDAATGS